MITNILTKKEIEQIIKREIEKELKPMRKYFEDMRFRLIDIEQSCKGVKE